MHGPTEAQKAVDAAGVDDVALLGDLQHWQKRAGAVIDTAPANVERALPFVAAIGNHAAAAADTGVVEEQVDFVGLVAVGTLVAKLSGFVRFCQVMSGYVRLCRARMA